MNFKSQKGFIASFIAIIVLFFMLNLALSTGLVMFGQQMSAENLAKSGQAHYTAESAIEDSLLRLKNSPQMAPLTYTLAIGASTAEVQIQSMIGGSRQIVSTGNLNDRIRKVNAVYALSGQGASFHYGAQVGEGGMDMANGSEIKGNVFSNGNITGSGTIDNDAIVAGNGHRLEGVHVKGNARAYSCKDAQIDGNLIYVVPGGTLENCVVLGETSMQTEPIAPVDMVITQDQINAWKAEAEVADCPYSNISGTKSMGPCKIAGSLTVNNNATLELTGTIYITGDISTSNGSAIRLDSGYGSLGGVIMADGVITVDPNVTFMGSGQLGSYLLAISNSSSSTAISVKNNTTATVFYAAHGGLVLNNGMHASEITGYKISLNNNAIIEYDSGLVNMFFLNGPAGGGSVASWKEE